MNVKGKERHTEEKMIEMKKEKLDLKENNN